MRECKIFTALDLSNKGIGPAGIAAIAEALAESDSLTQLDLLQNPLNEKAAAMLVEVAKAKKISLCGISPDQTKATLRGRGPLDCILIASDLDVRTSLKSCSLICNDLAKMTGWSEVKQHVQKR